MPTAEATPLVILAKALFVLRLLIVLFDIDQPVAVALAVVKVWIPLTNPAVAIPA
ncbi:MAG: hypothetical protein IPG18_18570 [Saprospiraceae bacterium]|nr:hypothetical protein [Saprospiraceae bacterium]